MSKWITVYIPDEAFSAVSKTSYKIDMPHNSELRGYCIWISHKLVNRYGWSNEVFFKKNFVFKAKKYGQGKYNKYSVVDEKILTGEILGEILENYQLPPLIHKPEILFPVKTEPLPELLDED